MNTPPSPEPLLQLATSLRRQGRFAEALAAVEKLLESNSQHAAAWNYRGNLLLTLGRNAEAITSYDRALALKADYPQARHNRGVALLGAGNLTDAEAEFRRVLSLNPEDSDARFHLGAALAAQSRHSEAVTAFNAAHAHGDSSAALFYSRAQSLLQLQLYSEALTNFDRAIAIAGNDPNSWLGRGIALLKLNRTDEALASFGECLRLRPGDKDALYNRANTYAVLKRFDEAGRDAATLLRLDPEYPYALGLLLHARLYSCDWRDLAELRSQADSAVKAGRRAVHPLLHLAISDSPELNLRAAQVFAQELYPRSPTPLWHGERYRHDKIRIAYLSADFYRHATAFLMAGVFEQHDRTQFEITALSYGPSDGSEMRRRLENAFDTFLDVRDWPDVAIAEKLKQMEIDIAIDLKGYTGHARPGILAARPAPVQAHYLGYPGSLGTSYIDYLVADEIIAPHEAGGAFTECIIRLPGCYQCNDSKRAAVPRIPTRAEAGLPDSGFVFCCFNSSFKITPEIFDLWMRLLNATPDSVLWLLEDNPLATNNLKKTAKTHGVAPERLVFARHLPVEEHIARLSLADLALDTFPYGAHTTASDAVWRGVPLVTMYGASFAARVAASVLTTAGLRETVTHSAGEYERCALRLARDRASLAALREKLKTNRAHSRLFDTAAFTRALESAFASMYERHQRGLPPVSFSVPE